MKLRSFIWLVAALLLAGCPPKPAAEVPPAEGLVMPIRVGDAAAPIPEPFVPHDASVDSGNAPLDASMENGDGGVAPLPVPPSAP